MTVTQKKHKDRLFRFIFGNPSNLEWTLSLYNAINGSNYDDPNAIEFNTIEDAIYLGMKNDVSFIFVVENELNLWEHQSSYNPNMPIRFLIYLGQLYDKYFEENNYYRYGSRLYKLPKPKCICFYNGTDERPEEEILRLSDAFRNGDDDIVDADVELKVRMLNVNYGKNRNLMAACKPLNEYSWLIEKVRHHEKIVKNLDKAFDLTLNELPNDFVLRKFLLGHRAEVKGMFLTEYNEEKERQLMIKEFSEIGREEGLKEGREEGRKEGLKEGRAEGRAEGLKEGREEGIKEGIKEGKAEGIKEGKAEGIKEGKAEGRKEGKAEGMKETKMNVAMAMLKKNLPLSLIEEISSLSENVIRGLANNIGVSIVG